MRKPIAAKCLLVLELSSLQPGMLDCPWNVSALLDMFTVQFKSFLLSVPEQRQKSPDPIKVSCYYFDPCDLVFSTESQALQRVLGMLVHVPLPAYLCQLVELS